MDIELVSLIIAVAVLAVTVEFNLEHLKRRISNWEISFYRSLSALAKASIDKKYLFSWNDIPGNDNGRLIEFLKQKFGIDWVKTAKIEKIDDKTIRVSVEKNYLSLSLNNERTNVDLKIDDGRTDDFIVKMENGELNIYGVKITKEIEEKEAKKINEQWPYVESLRNNIKHVNLIVLLLPIIVTMEVGIITLQFFQLFSCYEWTLAGLSKVILIAIVALTFSFFSLRTTILGLGDKNLSEYEAHNSRVITTYEFGML